MVYRITYSWGSKDVLPSEVSAGTAVEALKAFNDLKKRGMKNLRIYALDGTHSTPIVALRLNNLARAERGLRPMRGKPKARKAIASILLGIVASALPNSFGDFGIVTGSGSLRLARTARASIGTKRP